MMRHWTASPTDLAAATREWMTVARWFTGDTSADVSFTHASPIEANENVQPCILRTLWRSHFLGAADIPGRPWGGN